MIIPTFLWGKKIYPNFTAVCEFCEKVFKNRNDTLYDYMIFLGTLSETEGKKKRNELTALINNYNPLCEYKQVKCRKIKYGKNHHLCKDHALYNPDVVPMDTRA